VTKSTCLAFTIWDLLIVLVLVAVISGLLLPASGGSRKSPRISCISNLKQVGLAFRMWSGDNGEKFPMSISTDKGGSLEFIGTGEVFRHYLAVSNDLSSPKVLTCPSDKKRKQTAEFAALGNRNLSYFVGLDAVETNPQLILSGDRNISTNGQLITGVLTLGSDSPVSWTEDLHKRNGNVGLADGSAQQVTDSSLRQQVNRSPNPSFRLAIP
jgi:hypothetical protein